MPVVGSDLEHCLRVVLDTGNVDGDDIVWHPGPADVPALLTNLENLRPQPANQNQNAGVSVPNYNHYSFSWEIGLPLFIIYLFIYLFILTYNKIVYFFI